MELDTLIEVSPAEIRMAGIDQDGVLQSIEIERMTHPLLLGAVVRARVSRVEKAMRAAFVDLGPMGEALLPKDKDRTGKPLAEGQWVVVQINRDGQGGKGPAATVRPTLQDRYLSFSPFGDGLTFDRRTGQGRERADLETGIRDIDFGQDGGWLVRQAALAVSGDVLQQCAAGLRQRWEDIQAQNNGDKPAVLEAAPAAWERSLREAPPEGRIATDDRLLFGNIEAVATHRYPDLSSGLIYHNGPDTLFEASGVEEQIDEALSRYVSLPGGGNLVFDETEAMTVIDVNLADGAAALRGADAAVRLNIRAAESAGRQIRLRNLSGLIVIDFVKMQRRAEGKRVIEALRRALKGSRATADVLGMTAAGLVEITRQRSGPSFSAYMLAPTATKKEVLPVAEASRLLREALRLRGGGRPTATASQQVLDALSNALAEALAETETRLGQNIELVQKEGGRAEVRMEVRK